MDWLKKLVEVIPVLILFPLWAQLVFIATAVLAVGSIIIFAIWYPASTKDTGLPELTQLARKYGRKYVIESATMTWRLDFDATPSDTPRAADVRTVYTIFALEDLSIEKGSDFGEQYHTGVQGARVVYLRGSEQEKLTEPAVQNKQWTVLFNLKKGERRTLVTAARIVYSATDSHDHSSHGFGILGNRQQTFFYPNTEDVIGELIISVESDVVSFAQPMYGDSGLWDDAWTKRDQAGTPDIGVSESESVHHAIVAARWRKLEPRKNAGVLVRW